MGRMAAWGRSTAGKTGELVRAPRSAHSSTGLPPRTLPRPGPTRTREGRPSTTPRPSTAPRPHLDAGRPLELHPNARRSRTARPCIRRPAPGAAPGCARAARADPHCAPSSPPRAPHPAPHLDARGPLELHLGVQPLQQLLAQPQLLERLGCSAAEHRMRVVRASGTRAALASPRPAGPASHARRRGLRPSLQQRCHPPLVHIVLSASAHHIVEPATRLASHGEPTGPPPAHPPTAGIHRAVGGDGLDLAGAVVHQAVGADGQVGVVHRRLIRHLRRWEEGGACCAGEQAVQRRGRGRPPAGGSSDTCVQQQWWASSSSGAPGSPARGTAAGQARHQKASASERTDSTNKPQLADPSAASRCTFSAPASCSAAASAPPPAAAAAGRTLSKPGGGPARSTQHVHGSVLLLLLCCTRLRQAATQATALIRAAPQLPHPRLAVVVAVGAGARRGRLRILLHVLLIHLVRPAGAVLQQQAGLGSACSGCRAALQQEQAAGGRRQAAAAAAAANAASTAPLVWTPPMRLRLLSGL